ncbi:Pentatricopeptide repeat-containing protein, chloroplastic [Capsicum annuum]|uniref:Pentatricopeptide repeat-containing protein, chloroplastic n=1 Tax=Capsicum annuum TaxID=4072 RepID=A0A2G3A7D1_CAPAN|nr:Pentatricopeptide repeat-containing protein, chloroplastic [Capsicum annuum]
MGASSLQFHFFSYDILLKGINSTHLSEKLNLTFALKHSQKQGELSFTISDAADHTKGQVSGVKILGQDQDLWSSSIVGTGKVQKAGKVEHHLWKKRESAGSGQKAMNLVRIISGLPNKKESVYGALDKWIAWETEFPLIVAAKALRILRQRRLWKQVAKWMLSKGQGATMATYDALLLEFDMDNGVDEAEPLWNMILHTSTRSVSKRLFSRMISLYDHHHVPDKIVEVNEICLQVFADMEELGVKPDEDTVRRVARAFQMLGQEDKQKLVLKRYQSRWKYIHFNGERARVRRYME